MRDIDLGNRIKKLRTDQGLSLADLGKAIGTNHTTISRYENSKSIPGSDKLMAIAQTLKVTTDMILTGVSTPPPAPDLEETPVFGLEPQTMITLLRSLEKMKPFEREKVMKRIIQVEKVEFTADS